MLRGQVEQWLAKSAAKRISLPVLIRGLDAAARVAIAVSPRSLVDVLQRQDQYFDLVSGL